MKKGFTLLEILVVSIIIAILITVATPLYEDYTKKSRRAEVPYAVKYIVELQVTRKADPESGGAYAKSIESLEWATSNTTTSGKYFDFGTSGIDGCDPGTAADPLPIGLGEFWTLSNDLVTVDWRSGCMTSTYDLFRNSD